MDANSTKPRLCYGSDTDALEESFSTQFDAIPDALLHIVAGKLKTARDLVSLEITCKRCRSAAEDDNLWKKMYCERFGICASVEPPSWRDLYRFNHRLLHDILKPKAVGSPCPLWKLNKLVLLNVQRE